VDGRGSERAAPLCVAGMRLPGPGLEPDPELEPEPEPEPEQQPRPEQQLPVDSAPIDGCPAAVLGGVLSPSLFAAVKGDFFRVVESDFEPPEKEDSFTFGTYWFSRCGNEWWFQEQGDEDAAKDYHIDSDARIIRGADGTNDVVLENHPTVSSVFYLDDFGGGTAAFGQTKQPESGKLVPRLPTSAVVSFPHPNQLFVFRGDLFHGVLATTERAPADAERSRFTLLYNWWSGRPHGPCELPEDFAFGPPPASLTAATVATQLSWVATDGECSFGQSQHLPDWQSQRLPRELAAVERRCGAPLRISYGGNADSEAAERWLADPEDWTETGDQ
jgi:hypothetical protein